MALEIESVNPPSAIHLKDGDEKSLMAGDLEDGEIEDGEIPDDCVDTAEEVANNDIEASCTQTETTTTEVKSSSLSIRTRRSLTNRSHERLQNMKEGSTEDDWAGDVEKAIKAAMGSKDGQEGNAEMLTSGAEVIKTDEEKSRRKKRKKKHREDEEDRKEAKKRKKSRVSSKEQPTEDDKTGEQDDEDDDEMLFVRGASPVLRGGYSPPGFLDEPFGYETGGPFDDPYDSFCDDSDYEHEDFGRPRRGDEEGLKRGGRGAKRRQQGRGAGRGLVSKRQQGGRKEVTSVKGKRIGNKRQQQRTTMLMQDPRQGPDSICMFYMQGKCQKGEECPYSHDALPPRKMELCKFYLMDCCAKKDKCLYMHSDFPCKFHHTGLKCFAGDRCKFSHGTLTETLRAVLLKHLETAPKEILGDFPRLSREGAAAMVYNKKNRNKAVTPGGKKIPSLFEIEVPIPAQLLSANARNEEDRSPARRGTPMPESDNEDQDGSRTPMPSSPRADSTNNKDFSNRTSNRQRDLDDNVKLRDSSDEEPRPSRSFRGTKDDNRESNEEQDVPKRNTSYQDQDFSEQLQQLKMRFYQETLAASEDTAEGRHRHRHRRVSKNKSNQHRLGGFSPSHAADSDEAAASSKQEGGEGGIENLQEADEEGKLEIDDQQEAENEEDAEEETPLPPTASQESVKKEQSDNDHNSSGSMDAGGLPHNLPKKQRELFLRIQQQQREAADSSSQDQSGDDDAKDEDTEPRQEENWYSSDEEEASLADVLKNLSSQQQPTTSPPRASTTPPLPPPAVAPPNLDSIKLSDIDISESVSKLLSSIRNQQSAVSETTSLRIPAQTQVTAAAAPPPTVQARDPRLLSRDPRNRMSGTASAVPILSPSTYESSRQDPRTSRRTESLEERTSIYSSATTSSGSSSTNTLHGRSDGGGDVDLRNFLSNQQQQQNSAFDVGLDIDLRLGRASSSSSLYGYGDTDLRGAGPGGDVDLRGMLGLPFKPVPLHTPATEIDASLRSHPPIQYKVVPITIPRPDYSGLKLNTSDPQVWSDPRLCRLFKVSSNTVDSPASPPPPPPPPPVHPSKRSPSVVARTDPRRRSTPTVRLQEPVPNYSEITPSNSVGIMPNACMSPGMVQPMPTALTYDPRLPRNPRNAPGILGPAPLPPNYCPNTPRYEDMEEGNSNGSDTDLRMFYNRMGMDAWEQQPPQAQSQRMHRNRNWRNGRRNQQRFQPGQQDQQRSYTPSP